MANESPRRRRRILAAVRDLDLIAIYAECRGSERNARRDCWMQIVPQLLQLGVAHLLIERQEGIETDDKTCIGDALAKADAWAAIIGKKMVRTRGI